jgi:hypothetical protein
MEEFKSWLMRSNKLSERSARDVVCRLGRASKLVKLETNLDTDDLLHKMSKSPEFKSLSASVKSQIKRAVKLHRKFEGR